MTAHHNPKDKTLLDQPDIAVLHIQRAKAAKFNRAAWRDKKCARAAVTLSARSLPLVSLRQRRPRDKPAQALIEP
jgi:hypothetical protein